LSLDGGPSLLLGERHPPTGRGGNLALAFWSFRGPIPMVEHIAKLHDLGVDVLLLSFESSDCGGDDFPR
jgi:hypothetical protein